MCVPKFFSKWCLVELRWLIARAARSSLLVLLVPSRIGILLSHPTSCRKLQVYLKLQLKNPSRVLTYVSQGYLKVFQFEKESSCIIILTDINDSLICHVTWQKHGNKLCLQHRNLVGNTVEACTHNALILLSRYPLKHKPTSFFLKFVNGIFECIIPITLFFLTLVYSFNGRKFEHAMRHGFKNGLYVVTLGWFIDSVRRNCK